MTDDKIAADVTFKLAQSRRRERLIKQAQGTGDWWYVLLYIGIAVSYLLIARTRTDAYQPLFGMFAVIGVSEIRRLNQRINALTRLLEEEPVQ